MSLNKQLIKAAEQRLRNESNAVDQAVKTASENLAVLFEGMARNPLLKRAYNPSGTRLGPYEADTAADVAGLDQQIAAMARNRHYRARQGDSKLQAALTPVGGTLGEAVVPGASLGTSLYQTISGGPTSKTRARDKYEEHIAPRTEMYEEERKKDRTNAKKPDKDEDLDKEASYDPSDPTSVGCHLGRKAGMRRKAAMTGMPMAPTGSSSIPLSSIGSISNLLSMNTQLGGGPQAPGPQFGQEALAGLPTSQTGA